MSIQDIIANIASIIVVICIVCIISLMAFLLNKIEIEEQITPEQKCGRDCQELNFDYYKTERNGLFEPHRFDCWCFDNDLKPINIGYVIR